MERPKSPEKKDAVYFSEEIKRLTQEAVESDQKAVAVVLSSLRGAINGGALIELAEKCYEFSVEQKERLTRKPEKSN